MVVALCVFASFIKKLKNRKEIEARSSLVLITLFHKLEQT